MSYYRRVSVEPQFVSMLLLITRRGGPVSGDRAQASLTNQFRNMFMDSCEFTRKYPACFNIELLIYTKIFLRNPETNNIIRVF